MVGVSPEPGRRRGDGHGPARPELAVAASKRISGIMTYPDSLPRRALVTGAGRRIGRITALSLARWGFDVVVHYNRSAADAESVCREIADLGRRAVALRADLADEAAVADLVPLAMDGLGGAVGVLVNNASVFERDAAATVTRASWDRHMEANLRAPFVLTQAVAAALPAEATAVVVNLLDQRVWNLTPDFLSYTLSKAGLWTLTRTLALALAPRIRVAGIGPGPTMKNSRQTDAHFEAQWRSVPLQRPTAPEEVAHAIDFILRTPSLTGQMIALDGGEHLAWAQPKAGVVPIE